MNVKILAPLVAMAIIAMIIAITPVSAYTVRPAPGNDGVLVYMEGRRDAYTIMANPYWPAWAVVSVASSHGINVDRTIDGIAWEIFQHAFAYLFVWGDQGENPMNIVT